MVIFIGKHAHEPRNLLFPPRQQFSGSNLFLVVAILGGVNIIIYRDHTEYFCKSLKIICTSFIHHFTYLYISMAYFIHHRYIVHENHWPNSIPRLAAILVLSAIVFQLGRHNVKAPAAWDPMGSVPAKWRRNIWWLKPYGYGSIPMKIAFLMGWTSIKPSYDLMWTKKGYYWFWHTAIFFQVWLACASFFLWEWRHIKYRKANIFCACFGYAWLQTWCINGPTSDYSNPSM